MSYFPRIVGSWSIFLSLVMAICRLPRGKGWGKKRKGRRQKAGPDHVFLMLTNSKELQDFFFIIGFCPAVLQVATVAWSATGSKLHVFNLFLPPSNL